MKFKPLPELSYLNSLLNYDKETGIFTWKIKPTRKIAAGVVAGRYGAYGYLRIGIKGSDFYSHRLAYYMGNCENPNNLEIDHINGVRDDNRLCNLRLASRSQNGHNTNSHKDNKIGIKGISYNFSRKRYEAEFMKNGKRFRIRCSELEIAEQILKEERVKAHGAFTNHG